MNGPAGGYGARDPASPTGEITMTTLLSRITGPADLHALTDEQLAQLAQEMRDELVRVLSIRPAHFASNLGVVELCLALHLTFDFTKDRLIWDTGHQIYPHKLITGRYPKFETIRTRGGLMGYPNPHESPYDLFMTGHAGASISTALGPEESATTCEGRPDRHSVAVIGDGALPSGIVFEALNNAGGLNANLLVILNDNKMSICPRTGGAGPRPRQVPDDALLQGLQTDAVEHPDAHSLGRRHGQGQARGAPGRPEGDADRRDAVRGPRLPLLRPGRRPRPADASPLAARREGRRKGRSCCTS